MSSLLTLVVEQSRWKSQLSMSVCLPQDDQESAGQNTQCIYVRTQGKLKMCYSGGEFNMKRSFLAVLQWFS